VVSNSPDPIRRAKKEQITADQSQHRPHSSEGSATLIALRLSWRDDQMSQFERVYKIDRLLRGRVPPTKQRIMDDWFRASQWHPGQQLEELPAVPSCRESSTARTRKSSWTFCATEPISRFSCRRPLRQHVAETLRTAAEHYWLTKRTASRAQSLPYRRRAEVG
jgi:hypothetical protein